jgi:hypothetical protein
MNFAYKIFSCYIHRLNIDENIPSVYIKRITVEKERIKTKSKSTMTCHLYQRY